MNEAQTSLQAIKNTLESIEIKATVTNMERLLACQQLLSTLIEKVGDDHGNADSE